jgi:GcrA cell cycle regulator
VNWTDNTIQSLRNLWAEGYSTAEIGRRMGVSKNAVIGKAHRLKLQGRPSPIRRAEAGTPGAVRSRRPLLPQLGDLMPFRAWRPVSPEHPVRAEPGRRPFEHRLTGLVGTQQCRWPIGEPGKPDFRFCTKFAVVRRPYCEDHCGDAYRPLSTGSNCNIAEAYPR